MRTNTRRAVAPALLLVTLCAHDVRGQEKVPVTARLIENNLIIHFPLAPCTVPSAAQFVAKAVNAPAGIEYVAEPCQWDRPHADPSVAPVNLLGLTVQEALDTLVKLDARYRWYDSNGVLLMRPVKAWVDSKHFLHRTVAEFVFENKSMGGALNAIETALGKRSSPTTELLARNTAEGDREFSVSLGATSILDALNEIARVHGGIVWTVKYCLSEVIEEHAQIMFSTHDGAGLVRNPAKWAEVNGKRVNLCTMR